nr:DUF6402 family protein [Collimonas silvisoli]
MKEILSRSSNLKYDKCDQFPKNGYKLDAWQLSGNDIQKLHKNYQFQRIDVDTNKPDRFKLFVFPSEYKIAALDDLFGTIGGFNIYAAIDEAYYERTSLTTAKVKITRLAVYVKYGFNFYDKKEERGNSGSKSQYLGHWGYGGLRLVLTDALFGNKNDATEQAACQYPVYTNSPTKNCIFYPVFNSDFRKWQMKHKRGGDFLIYSDRKIIYLDNPIVVELGL